ncbi:CHASE3 domain-containing protein [Brachymonas denitrificans]|nr:CHASE3 domain-containing protein [Brachymonas denitrificans]
MIAAARSETRLGNALRHFSRPHAMLWAALVMALVLLLNEFGYMNSREHLEQSNRLEQQRVALNNLRTAVIDAETLQRGYLISGDKRYLGPYQLAVSRIEPALDRARSFYVGSQQSLSEFATISRPISRRIAEMEVTVRMRQSGGGDVEWLKAFNTDAGQTYMDTARTGLDRLRQANDRALVVSKRALERNLLAARLVVLLVILLGAAAFYLLVRQSRRIDHIQEERRQLIQQERDQLDTEVRERTVQLSELTTHVMKVQEAERGRMAQELHDEMGALLTAAKLDTARIKSRLGQLGVDDEKITQRLQHLVESLNAGVAFKRQLIEELQPSSLTHLGLRATLENYAREFSERTEISVETDIEPVDLAPDAQLVVFRVMQEALTNISKYAQATHVRVMLHDKKDYALLQVLDDGVGFNVNQKVHASYGLSGMRHRLEAMHGSLRIVSAPGRGTRIEGSLPQARHRMAEPVRQEPPAAAGMEEGSPAMLQAGPAPATLG